MADVLARIVERKRGEVAERLGGRRVEAPPTTRSLRSVLSQSGARFIMEVKRRSPSGHVTKVAPADAIAAYAGVADAVSVLTDGADFGGSLDDLREARRGFEGPILAKDFIVDPAQVGEARAAGADAVLAMLSVLTNAEAAEVLAEARRFGMDAIVEVHDEQELGRALALGAAIVGINNRDLKTLRTDLSVTERLAPRVPADVLLISESGVASRSDVERLAPVADGFLVGSSLMASNDIRQAARALVHGRVKICGLTDAGDVALAARGGATHAGFVMVQGTPRAVSGARAAELASVARSQGLKSVGVFRDAEPAAVATAAASLGLDAVQLHGRESEADIAALRRKLATEVEIWAACAVGKSADCGRKGADRTVFDTSVGGGSGGTGKSFDWRLLASRPDLPSAFVAGGIGPDNACAAAALGAFGLDAGSKLEARPGRKDAAKVGALFAALRPKDRRAA